ncbi:MAG TPA: hypothetical protein PKD54_00245 [Pirellulaceae bacterium]|nr:hypothetical protein [Pirellulaceae bacterium]
MAEAAAIWRNLIAVRLGAQENSPSPRDPNSGNPEASAEIVDQLFQLPELPGYFSMTLGGRAVPCPEWSAEPVWQVCFWSPLPIPRLRTLCLASSRIGRHPEERPKWIAALRTAVCHCSPQQEALLTAPGMCTHAWVERLSDRLGVPRIVIQWIPADADIAWFEDQCAHRPRREFCLYAITLCDASNGPHLSEWNSVPDRLPMLLAAEVRALLVRGSGNLHRLILERLKLSSDSRPLTCILHDGCEPNELLETFIQMGAVPWIVNDPGRVNPQPEAPISPEPGAIPSALPAVIPWRDYVAHATRAPLRPRSGSEIENWEYFDRLLFGPQELSGALLSLIRILVSERVMASRYLIRSQQPVVCFTEQPVNLFPSLRVFRPHLSRWDFESYGIAIRREILKAMGGGPVMYGDDSLWRELSVDERPFFQIAQSQRSGKWVDWQVEKEWRVVGDVNLRWVRGDDAFVFVKMLSEVPLVQPYSRWPVIALEAL